MKAIFTGRRINGKGVLYRFELLPNREEVFYKRVRRVWIGYVYECKSKTMSIRPKRLDDEHESNSEWEALDALVDARNAKRRAENKIKRKSTTNCRAAIAALAPLVKGVRAYDRVALVNFLISKAEKLK